jgi:soluble cytochrome b562
MEVIEEGMKKLRRSLKKADENPASLEAIAKMQTAAVASKALTPAMAATLPEADRAKFAQAYRKDMAAMIADVCQMEIALLDGDNAKAQELHKKLGEHEDAGHKKYIKEEK